MKWAATTATIPRGNRESGGLGKVKVIVSVERQFFDYEGIFQMGFETFLLSNTSRLSPEAPTPWGELFRATNSYRSHLFPDENGHFNDLLIQVFRTESFRVDQNLL
jgi:hypothetical protein